MYARVCASCARVCSRTLQSSRKGLQKQTQNIYLRKFQNCSRPAPKHAHPVLHAGTLEKHAARLTPGSHVLPRGSWGFPRQLQNNLRSNSKQPAKDPELLETEVVKHNHTHTHTPLCCANSPSSKPYKTTSKDSKHKQTLQSNFQTTLRNRGREAHKPTNTHTHTHIHTTTNTQTQT